MKNTCYIVAFSEKTDSRMSQILKPQNGDLVIAADIGYRTCTELRVNPNIIIGDFDSLDSSIISSDADIITYPVKKDETDTLLAVNEGLRRGYTDFIIIGGLGGRFDHSIANLSILKYLFDKGCSARLVDNRHEITYISCCSTQFIAQENEIISLFPFSEKAVNVKTSGLMYPLNNEDLSHGFPLGVSNKPMSNTIKISVEKGDLLIIRVV